MNPPINSPLILQVQWEYQTFSFIRVANTHYSGISLTKTVVIDNSNTFDFGFGSFVLVSSVQLSLNADALKGVCFWRTLSFLL